jgi:hypothetical protein
MAERYDRLHEIVRAGQPMSVRHAYYRAVVAGLVEKNDSGYTNVQRAIVKMRKCSVIPYIWITDSTRWCRRPTTYNSVEDLLLETARTYRRSLWATSDHRVEVWCESESIAGVLAEIKYEWDVPLFPTRGQSSDTFPYNSAAEWNADGRPVQVYYVGDHDPAGLEIEAKLIEKLEEHTGVYFGWKRLAVTWDQVEQYDLPGTTPKKHYGYQASVEAEALPASTLRTIVENAIVAHLDTDQVEHLYVIEQEEREQLERLAASFGGGS